jgi:hypothetical protein
MYAHERSLVAKYQNRPFVLLGVNSDADREGARLATLKKKLPWRSWWVGSPHAPIPELYRVTGWPTIYLIDEKGIIRYAQLHGQTLDDAIEFLVREAEKL